MNLAIFSLYLSTIAVIILAVLLMIQWIAQIRNKTAALISVSLLSEQLLQTRFAPFRAVEIKNNAMLSKQRHFRVGQRIFSLLFISPWLKIHSKYQKRPRTIQLIVNIIIAVTASRLLVFIIGSIWSLYFTDAHTLDIPVVWLKWDAFHYLFIAQNGYVSSPHEKAVLIAFYPFYPLLIKLCWFFLRNYIIAAFFVSITALVAACIYMYKLVEMTYDSNTADKTVLFLLVSPFSVFFGLILTESLFLLLTLAFFYYLKKQCWVISGIIGCLAAFTKNQGILLLVPYFMEAITNIAQQRNTSTLASYIVLGIKKMFPACFIPIGFLLYLLINYIFLGDPFKFLEYQQEHWHNSFGFFAENIRGMIAQATTYSNYGYRFSLMVLQPIVFFSALLSIFAAIIKKIPVSFTAFNMAFLLVSFSPTWLLSAARYSTALFIVPMLLAIFSTNTKRLVLLSSLSIALMCFFVIVFVEGVMF